MKPISEPLMLRAFIGFGLVATAQEQVLALMHKLHCELAIPNIRWLTASNLHVTLSFLGVISSERLPLLQAQLNNQLQNLASFSLEFNELAGFPSAMSSKVISLQPHEKSQVIKLATAVRQAVADSDFTPENKLYRPHLSLGWLPKKLVLANIYPKIISPPIVTRVNKINIYQSLGHSHYKSLTEFPLS